ncbi:putative extracellular elastinolytic metalloproteinase protein [Eutypa lata UCREL1]|uniref:Extracellular metalloproteinase n=1 Tax=Eutypa lata (strain UCR-EL1) TaxID=1287681 RepID=M7SX25_EUTLA|nr:putative extracellular elastinolytic metalloproteinase protein [Eutypa lata UCREL1]
MSSTTGCCPMSTHPRTRKSTVCPWGTNDPDEGDREIITNPWDLETSEFTWLSDGTENYTTTWGNNGFAQTNPNGGNSYENNYRPTSTSLSFEYTYDTSMASPSAYVDASVTQLFYTANTYHDLLHTLGFTEAAGNFEVNNNGQGGQGNDGVILNAQDGSGTNNANFATPVDGRNPRMRMYIWTYTTPRRDCTFEAGVVIHEFTHGLSNRLTGGPANVGCLNGLESGGMGEGWGDWYATAIRLKAGDTRETDYALGAWVYGDPNGIRDYVYSTNMDTNPYTYESVDEENEVHAIGTIWATMLYEVLWNLIDKHGKNDADKPEFDENGVPTDGKYLAMKLVLDGMALQPCNPNFVSARDAILDADTALTGGDNQCEIWTAFAKRGLGENASYSSSNNEEDFTIPDGVC